MLKILILSFLCCILLTGCSNNDNNNFEVPQNTTSVPNTTNTTPIVNTEVQSSSIKEEKIASFTTEILSNNDNRQNNVELACKALSGTIVKAGETFSFCDTLGPATPEDGYEKADGFDGDGDVIQMYGAGKCQISSTLYNAVLETPNLEVVERHAHSNKVYYVPEGKDAAVAYGSIDFKFKNNNSFDIKISASCTDEEITTELYKI